MKRDANVRHVRTVEEEFSVDNGRGVKKAVSFTGTNDEENFWRLVRILLDDVPNKLREMFKSNCLRQEES